MKTPRYSFQDFQKEYPDNKACLDHLFKSLYPNPKCPKCKRVGKYYLRKKSSKYTCACGSHSINPKQGTIFQKSDTDLQKWYFAMYLVSTAKNGISAKELERQLKVTYKCAYRIAFQIRKLMEQVPGIFDCTIEADETYVGGVRRGTRGRGAKGKTAVFGLIERDGDVFAKAVPNVKASTVMKLIRENVKIGSNLMTDEFRSYAKAKKMGYKHQTVEHGAKEYVRGKVHTNNIEGFWSQLKRSINGTHHSVSPKRLQAYCDERVWSWNRRTSETPLFSLLLQEACASRR